MNGVEIRDVKDTKNKGKEQEGGQVVVGGLRKEWGREGRTDHTEKWRGNC